MKFAWHNVGSWATTILDMRVPIPPSCYFEREMVQSILVIGCAELDYSSDVKPRVLQFVDKKDDIKIKYTVGSHLMKSVPGYVPSHDSPVYDALYITAKKVLYCFCAINAVENERLYNILGWFFVDHPMAHMSALQKNGTPVPFHVFELIASRKPRCSPITMHLFEMISLGSCFPFYQNESFLKEGGVVTMGICPHPYCKACRDGQPLMRPKTDAWIEDVRHCLGISIGEPPRLTPQTDHRSSASVDEIYKAYFQEDVPLTPPSKKKKKKKALPKIPKTDSIEDLLREVFSISMDDL